MFGTFRLLLAIAVLISHVFEQMPFNIGVAAVVNFFFISGYVIAILIARNYSGLGRPTMKFYVDRLLRIYPQFFVWTVLTQVGLIYFQFDYYAFRSEPTVSRFLLNLALIPLNYFMFLPSLLHYQLIPPAWSLGLEEQFYWFFPFVVSRKWVERIVAILSFAIFMQAVFGEIHPEIFGYRLLPGILFVFIMGKGLSDYHRSNKLRDLSLAILLYGACLVLTMILWNREEWIFGKNIELLSGILMGFPIVFLLGRMRRRKWDDFLGRASYGVFLCHVFFLNLMVHFGLFPRSPTWFTITLICLSVGGGIAGSQFIEPLFRRLQLRLRPQAKAS